MKSWAVPKGPSADPKVKRLAVPTEDHPLSYRNFEGTIPEGEYGGGTVLVWDAGTYRNLTEDHGTTVPMDAALAKGHVKFRLSGKKLKGGYALTRFRHEGRGPWLLVKTDDDDARPGGDLLADEPTSVRSGRTIEEIAGAG